MVDQALTIVIGW